MGKIGLVPFFDTRSKAFSPSVAHFAMLRHAMHVTPTQKVRHFAPLDVLFPTVCHT